jgi:quercetin dioxygenase-like cupin family protein
MRVFTNDEGVSMFGEVDIEFTTQDFAPPAPPLGMSTPFPAAAVVFLHLPAGWEDAAHPAPARQLMCIVSGVAETTANGETRRLEPGQPVLVEDTSGTGHGTKIIEDTIPMAVRLA